ncbi:MAG: FG-GAP repeat domain-containing protein [Phycisphaerales bacterium JB038]
MRCSLVVLATAPAWTEPCQPVFPGELFDTVAGPTVTVTADLNGDGVLDVAVCSRTHEKLAVHLGDGDGTLPWTHLYDLVGEPVALAVADVDVDGDTDLVAACEHDREAAVLLNNGDGSFAEPVRYACGDKPSCVVLADLSGNGAPDIVVTNPANFAHTMTVLLNDGSGTYGEPTSYPAGYLPQSAVAGDLDGDGDVDVVVVSSASDDLTIFRNTGDGLFESAGNYPLGDTPYAIKAGDLDADQDVDLVVADLADLAGADVTVLLNQGDATFVAGARFDVGESSVLLELVDFDGDGHLDLLAASPDENSLSLLPGVGDGSFLPRLIYPTVRYPSGLATGDVDADGRLDVVLSGWWREALLVLRGKEGGQLAARRAVPTDDPPTVVHCADLDLDGDEDICFEMGHGVSVILNAGTGDFGDMVSYPLNDSPVDVATCDMTGDGYPDIVAVDTGFHGTLIEMLPSIGDGSFGLPVTIKEMSAVAVDAADLNHDGHADLAVGTGESERVLVLLADGAGGFNDHVDYPVVGKTWDLLVLDLDGDSHPDIVSVGAGPAESLSILFGAGDGTFGPADSYELEGQPTSVASGDFNGDGHADFVVTGWQNNTISLLLNNGDATFAEAQVYEAGLGPRRVTVGDFNADGLDDVATADEEYPEDSISVWLGVGDGTLGPRREYDIGEYPNDLCTADLDGNGSSDLVVATAGGLAGEHNFSILLSECELICLGDVDGDGATGQPDLGILLASYELDPDDPFFDPRADLDGDGAVGQSDLGVLLADYECGL